MVRIPDDIKKVKFSVLVPYKDGPRWETADYYGGDEDLRKIVIAQLDRMEPMERPKVVIYYYGSKRGTLYWRNDRTTGADYIFDAPGFYEILYKNGRTKRMVPKTSGRRY